MQHSPKWKSSCWERRFF